MLTRLKVSGFKNLIDTEVHFGPLTCIAGFNGVGKSNMFDAIRFLSALADHSFVEAASMTRGGSNLIDLFTVGGDRRMRFACDLLIPKRGLDDFRQPAEASYTFLTYELVLRLEAEQGLPHVRLEHERLTYIPKRDAKQRLGFTHRKSWRDSVISTSSRRVGFISTEGAGDERIIRLSSDKMRDSSKTKRGGGRPADFLARHLPRTVLSAAQNADEARTAVLVRSEMRAWRILQLEPSALRKPDELQSPTKMDTSGRHLAASLYRLAQSGETERIYAEVSNRLAELVEDVGSVRVDRDEARRVLRLVMTDRAGVELPASSLSDGTLRFVALSVMAQDPDTSGVVLLEEPENGIHPGRMDAMMRLLSELAVDTDEPIDEDNPLRQVVISTHSPIVAARVSPDQLIFASRRDVGSTAQSRGVVFRPIQGTWRAGEDITAVARGDVIAYLGTIRPAPAGDAQDEDDKPSTVYDTITHQIALFEDGL